MSLQSLVVGNTPYRVSEDDGAVDDKDVDPTESCGSFSAFFRLRFKITAINNPTITQSETAASTLTIMKKSEKKPAFVEMDKKVVMLDECTMDVVENVSKPFRVDEKGRRGVVEEMMVEGEEDNGAGVGSGLKSGIGDGIGVDDAPFGVGLGVGFMVSGVGGLAVCLGVGGVGFGVDSGVGFGVGSGVAGFGVGSGVGVGGFGVGLGVSVGGFGVGSGVSFGVGLGVGFGDGVGIGISNVSLYSLVRTQLETQIEFEVHCAQNL